ncbi:hypothetical protein EW146_g9312 [Bondarzewia mesenterica]|uniref:Uncharacterized protein n=1 Tax=Bondarzewia mesenterica TaxID=1095465 RepID=A0A4S4L7K1_9AGAM|nr:hypothetical protein EW146_g9312 [Bondarzewia mesenterica]
MPPTPPHDAPSIQSQPSPPPPLPSHQSVTENLSEKVHSLAKRLSSTYLGSACEKPVALPPALSVISSASASSGTDEDTDDEDSERERLITEDERDSRRFVLRPVPTTAYRGRAPGRKVSDATVMESDVGGAMLCTAVSDPMLADCAYGDGRDTSPLIMTTKRRNGTQRGSVVGSGPGNGKGMQPSKTLPNLARAAPSTTGAGGFLSRMWGAATKGSAAAATSSTGKTPLVDPAEPEGAHTTVVGIGPAQAAATGAASRLGRLAHSRSAMFRSAAAVGGEGEC